MAEPKEQHLDLMSRLQIEKWPRPDIPGYEEPCGKAEQELAQIWSEVLRIECIGRKDNIFSLGGDSLHMILIASRIRRDFGVEIPIEDFFEAPTIEGLAATLREEP